MIYTFPIYVPASAAAVGLIALVVGVFLIRAKRSYKAVLGAFFVAVLAGGILASMLAMDRVVLDDEKLEQTTGFWFAPTVKGFRLADVASIRISSAMDSKGRQQEIWIVSLTDGKTREINPGDLWENNGPDIRKRLQAKGIKIQ